MTDIRIGDRFKMEVEVTKREFVHDDGFWCRLVLPPRHERESVWITNEALLASERLPRAIKVGDRVKLAERSATTGKVMALDDGFAAVKWDNNARTWMPTGVLTPLESGS